MKTLKKIQITLMVLGCIILGTTPMNGQQNRYAVKGTSQSATVLMQPSSAIALMGTALASVDPHSSSVIKDKTAPYYFNAGSDVTICNGESYTLSGINTSKAKSLWTTQGDGVFDNPLSLNAVYTPGKHDQQAGKVKLVLSSIGPISKYYPYTINDYIIITMSDYCGEPLDDPKN